MRITPLDIQQKGFPLKFRGFHAEEVSSFLELIREEIEHLLRENAVLKEQIQKGDEETRRFWDLESLLNRTLLEANQMAEEYRVHGRKEAGLVIEEAERKAEEMICRAHEEAQGIQEEIEALRIIRKKFRREMRVTLERFLQIISGEGELQKEELNFHALSDGGKSWEADQREEGRERNADAESLRSER